MGRLRFELRTNRLKAGCYSPKPIALQWVHVKSSSKSSSSPPIWARRAPFQGASEWELGTPETTARHRASSGFLPPWSTHQSCLGMAGTPCQRTLTSPLWVTVRAEEWSMPTTAGSSLPLYPVGPGVPGRQVAAGAAYPPGTGGPDGSPPWWPGWRSKQSRRCRSREKTD